MVGLKISVEDRLKLIGLSIFDAENALHNRHDSPTILGLNDHDAFCWRARMSRIFGIEDQIDDLTGDNFDSSNFDGLSILYNQLIDTRAENLGLIPNYLIDSKYSNPTI